MTIETFTLIFLAYAGIVLCLPSDLFKRLI